MLEQEKIILWVTGRRQPQTVAKAISSALKNRQVVEIHTDGDRALCTIVKGLALLDISGVFSKDENGEVVTIVKSDGSGISVK